MAISNVMVYSQDLGKPSRVKIKRLDDGRRVRVLQKSPDDVLDKV
jgi:ribosomal protein L24